ncbi:hypothetical protein LZF95_15035 [Algoriphagus sp. AGSA1]|uniref:hypothetical protein n=1 Tax=Algoriphagus sp. AGSA1 TaxID=2907213 RepID=UPI001F3DD08C|nr:hypothetical protein [Algoriphagus sp. AGSA1]MCE7055994.1 hypothetical protein [Algoriphagus sp. AGSA1]
MKTILFVHSNTYLILILLLALVIRPTPVQANFILPYQIDIQNNDTIRGLHIRNHTYYDVKDPIHWFCEKYDIRDAYIRVSFLDRSDFYGMISHQQPNIYFIRLRKGCPNVGVVLMHELMHMRQYHSGQLTQSEQKSVMYHGRKINLDEISYKEREFEKDANREGSVLWKTYKRLLRKGNQGG